MARLLMWSNTQPWHTVEGPPTGLGSRIIRLAEDEARRRGCTAAFVYTARSRRRSFTNTTAITGLARSPVRPPARPGFFSARRSLNQPPQGRRHRRRPSGRLPRPFDHPLVTDAPSRIVTDGAPTRGIAPCGACHGDLDSKAGAGWLARQPLAYLRAQL